MVRLWVRPKAAGGTEPLQSHPLLVECSQLTMVYHAQLPLFTRGHLGKGSYKERTKEVVVQPQVQALYLPPPCIKASFRVPWM